MKKWTVMLIPHDRSSSRTLTVSSAHFWTPLMCLAVLVFACAFLFQRQWTLSQHYETTRQEAITARQQPVMTTAEQEELDALREELGELREESESLRAANEADRTAYREGISSVTARLNEVLEIESQLRTVTGLAPRKQVAPVEPITADGQGGPPEGFGTIVLARQDQRLRPPFLIYGMSRPSADLIMQEMDLRTGSMHELLRDIETQRDRIERTPSVWPLMARAGKISSDFGWRKDPFSRRLRHHDGVDFAAPTGTKVISTAKGTVVEAGWRQYYGNVVRIDHGNGLETLYAHLSKTLVKEGEFVMRSDLIGLVGSTGRSTGAHLHYEVREKGAPIDAGKYLGG
jgi:murein DD-endopeptidase MepM/ murein hydrolase activator NlpD